MTGMEDVLTAHTAAWTTWGDYPQDSEYYTCYCGEVKWHVNTSTDYYQAHATHVAEALQAAGFGSQHDAWDEGFDDCWGYYNSEGAVGTQTNPYPKVSES